MKLVFLLGPHLDCFQREVLETFFSSSRHQICAAVVDNRTPPSLLQKLVKNLKRGRGGFVLVMAWRSLFRKREAAMDTATLFDQHKIPVIGTKKPYAEETLAAIRHYEPDALLLLGGFGIVKKRLLELAPGGVISYHHGDMRHYRGMPPCFWELYNGEREMGVTVQRLGAGLDSGEPLVEKKIPISSSDTFRTLSQRAFAASTGMMLDAANDVEDPAFEPAQISEYGNVYTLPTLSQWIRFHLRILARRLHVLLGRTKE